MMSNLNLVACLHRQDLRLRSMVHVAAAAADGIGEIDVVGGFMVDTGFEV